MSIESHSPHGGNKWKNKKWNIYKVAAAKTVTDFYYPTL